MALTVPLELRNVPQNMAVVGDVVGSLEMRIQGQERLLRDITIGKKVFGLLDLSSAKSGQNTFRLSPDDISRPTGVSVTHISPYEIIVRLEPLVRKRVILVPSTQGSPASGYVFTGAKAIPEMITVEGPEGVVQMLGTMRTFPVDMEGAKGTFTVTPRIDYQGKTVTIIDKDIRVELSIRKRRGTR